jgi:hypothetical protein
MYPGAAGSANAVASIVAREIVRNFIFNGMKDSLMVVTDCDELLCLYHVEHVSMTTPASGPDCNIAMPGSQRVMKWL